MFSSDSAVCACACLCICVQNISKKLGTDLDEFFWRRGA